jgi:hypothetical protein
MNRPRHRLLIAAAIVVALIGGLWWLTRPRIDPRFVGTWEIYESSYSNSDDFRGEKPEQSVIFTDDGLTRPQTEFLDEADSDEAEMLWRVDSSRGILVLSEKLTPIDQFILTLKRLHLKITGGSVLEWDSVMTIQNVTNDRIVLTSEDKPGKFYILKRVSPADPVPCSCRLRAG